MGKKNYISILLFLCFLVSAQRPNDNLNLPDIVIPSQETFAISRINYEPNSSGQFSYQYSIDNSTKTPISLNYTSGVRVDDVGTSTGMSWQLSAGGAISRIVKDRADEKNTNWKPDSINEVTDLQQIRNAAATGNHIDTEYDWFNYSISNGLNGSFYIDYDLNVYIESGDKIKIEISDVTPPGSPNRSILEFKITDNSGIVYYFGGSQSNIETTIYTDRGTDRLAATGWYIYKIETATNKTTSFNYNPEEISYWADLSAGFSVQPNCPPPIGEGGQIFTGVNISKSITKSTKPKISSIVQDNTEVKFFYTKERKDLFYSNPENNLLTSIEIRSSNRLVNTFIFDYFDVKAFSAETYYQLPFNEESTTNRHFLKSILQVNKESKTEFEYYNLELLPGRFSLKTDYYGYPNSAENASPFPKIAADNNFGIFKHFSIVPQEIMSADKSVNPLLASVGNLKKLLHPTKGISEIFYEPNSSMEMVNEFIQTSHTLAVEANNCDSNYNNPLQWFRFQSNGGFIEFLNNVVDYRPDCDFRSSRDNHQLRILDETTGSLVTSGNHKIDFPFIAEDGTNNYPIPTENGHWYRIEYSAYAQVGAISGTIDFRFNGGFQLNEKMRYFGGSRIYSINESDLEGNSYSKKFYYNKLSNIASQSTSIADYNPLRINASIENTALICSPTAGFPVFPILPVYTASQNSILPLFNHRRNNPFYIYVTEVVENKSAVERRFSYEKNADPYIGRLPEIYYLPKSNDGEIRSNLLKEENIYKFDDGFKILTSKLIDYDYSQIKIKKSYVFRQNFTYYPLPGEEPLINISYGSYNNYYGFFKPTKTTTTEYLSETPVFVTTSTIEYGNPSHYQPTFQKTIFPDGSSQLTNYKYAHEKPNQKLIDANMIAIPLITETTKTADGVTKTISKTETIYPTSLPDTQTGNLLLPKSSSSLDLLTGGMLTEVTYNQYDSKGNLQQYTTRSGVTTAIVWGYNNTQPIAKIVGAKHPSQIAWKTGEVPQSLIDTIVIASDDDANDTSADNPKEQVLLTALDTFRKDSLMADYQITTYTYDPLIGVRSITPPNGITENYIYDTAGRLKEVRDINGNILKENKYNYKQ